MRLRPQDRSSGAPLFLLSLLFGAAISCTSGPAAPATEQPRPSNAVDQAPTSRPEAHGEEWFVDRAAAAGIDFLHFNGMSGRFYQPEIMGPGVAMFDYDNDGDLDVYLVQGGMLGKGQPLMAVPKGPLTDRLYRNDLEVHGDGVRLRFTDVTERAGLSPRGYGMGVATGDVDNDGWVDLYLTGFGRNQMFRKFTAVLALAGAIQRVTPAQDVTVTFSALVPQATQWTAAADRTWVQIASPNGTGGGRFTVSIRQDMIDPTVSLSTATITVSAPGPAGTLTTTVTVRLSTGCCGDELPFGVFDTPVAGATVRGSIAVTGWALDRVAVDRVEIWRDLAAGETTAPYIGPGPGNGKVFIANAFFVPGARPDVVAAYSPTHMPMTYRAGWGYLLLTQGLWNQGNGTFTLYAFAFDTAGQSAELGRKTITASNQTATQPFGSIDTPTYGQAVSGTIWNYGWALTPNANATDQRSCTIANSNVFVAIDSGLLMPVTYGQARSDIAASFPGFSNGANGGGAYSLDTTTLSNGTHQIGWYVVDNCGRADGIGSRFFTVQN